MAIIFGFIIATVSLLLSLWVFPSYASFAMVTFTVMAVLPLMVRIMKIEKEHAEKKWSYAIHARAVEVFAFLFIGFLLAFTFWFLLLPVDVANNLFFLQINTITEINAPTGAAIFSTSHFWVILLNNLRIFALSVLFSFIFGSGAIFILVWNASVISVAMATAIKISAAAGGAGSASYFGAFAFSLIRFMIHGLPEMTGYFIGGLAGAILSFTLLDYKRGSKKFTKELKKISKDAAYLCLAGIIILAAAALIEVAITPLFIR